MHGAVAWVCLNKKSLNSKTNNSDHIWCRRLCPSQGEWLCEMSQRFVMLSCWGVSRAAGTHQSRAWGQPWHLPSSQCQGSAPAAHVLQQQQPWSPGGDAQGRGHPAQPTQGHPQAPGQEMGLGPHSLHQAPPWHQQGTTCFVMWSWKTKVCASAACSQPHWPSAGTWGHHSPLV